MRSVNTRGRTHNIISRPRRGVNPKTKVQELKQSTSVKANPQTTTPIQRRVISSKITKYKKPIGNKDNIQSRFIKGISNQATDYQAIVNPDYEHKSILNQAIDKSLQGEFGAAGKLIQDNPARFAGNVAVEAASFLVPVGSALKVAKGVSVAVKQSQKLPKITEKVISKVTGKPERISLYQVIAKTSDGKVMTSPWMNKGKIEPMFFWKASAGNRDVVIKEIKVHPSKASRQSANRMKYKLDEADVYDYPSQTKTSKFYTPEEVLETGRVGDTMLSMNYLGMQPDKGAAIAKINLNRPMAVHLDRYRSKKYVLATLKDREKEKIIGQFTGPKDNQKIANILTRQGYTKKQITEFINSPVDPNITNPRARLWGKRPGGRLTFNAGRPTPKTLGDAYEKTFDSKVNFGPIIAKMEQGKGYQKFIPFAASVPILGVTQKTTSLRKQKR